MFNYVKEVLQFKQLSGGKRGQVFFSCNDAGFGAYRPVLLPALCAEGPRVNGRPGCVIFVFFVRDGDLFVHAYRCCFEASARARDALVDVRNLDEGLLTLLRSRLVRIKRRQEMRASTIFRRWGGLCSCFYRVILRVRLVLCRLGSECRRVNVTRPTRRVVGYTRVFVNGAYYGAVTREDGGSGEGILVRALSVAPSVGAIVVSHAQRAGGGVGYRAYGRYRDLLFYEGLQGAKEVAGQRKDVFIGGFFVGAPIVFGRGDIVQVNCRRSVRGAPHRRVNGLHVFRVGLVWFMFARRKFPMIGG